jgi:hypothetical protein
LHQALARKEQYMPSMQEANNKRGIEGVEEEAQRK